MINSDTAGNVILYSVTKICMYVLVVKETREYWCSIYIYMYMCEMDREKMKARNFLPSRIL